MHPVKKGAMARDPFQPQATHEVEAATPMLTGMNQEALKAILEDVHLGRLVAPEEIASMIGYCVENEALNATTIEITGGLCYPKGIAK